MILIIIFNIIITNIFLPRFPLLFRCRTVTRPTSEKRALFSLAGRSRSAPYFSFSTPFHVRNEANISPSFFFSSLTKGFWVSTDDRMGYAV